MLIKVVFVICGKDVEVHLKMKIRLMALMLMALMVLAVPAFAETDAVTTEAVSADSDGVESDSSDSDSDSDSASDDASDATTVDATSDRPAAKPVKAVRRANKLKANVKARRAALDNLQDRNARLEKIKADRADLRANAKERTTTYRACVEDKGKFNFECKQLASDLRKDAGEKASLVVLELKDKLEAMKERINADEDLSAEEKEAALARIDARLERLAEVEAEVDAFGEDPSQRKIKAFAERARGVLRDAQSDEGVTNARKFHRRISNAVDKLSAANDKLSNVLTRLSEAGKDVSAAQSALDSYSAAAEDAANHLAAAEELYGAEDRDVEAIKTELRAAVDAIKEAKGHLKTVLTELRAAAGQ